MVPPARRALLLAVLAALAGCTTFGLAPAPPTHSATATPAWPTEVPPGVNHDRVVNPLDLVRAHTAALTGRSFTFRSTVVVRTIDGVKLGEVRTVRRVGPDGRFVHRMRADGVVPSAVSEFGAIDAYSNGSIVVIRFTRDSRNNTLTTAARESPMRAGDVVGKGPLYSMLSATEPRVLGPIRRGGVTYLHVRGTNGSTRLGFVEARNGTFEALIAPSGLITRFAFSYHATDSSYRDWKGRIHRTVSFSAVGTTAVERPDWVDAAIPNATAVPTGR